MLERLVDYDTKSVDVCSLNDHVFAMVSSVETMLTFSPNPIEFRVSYKYDKFFFNTVFICLAF